MKQPLKVLAAAAACAVALTGCVEDENTPPTPLDDVRPSHAEDMQRSLSAYFSVHGLDRSATLPEGLTIPWGAKEGSLSGYLLSTGETSERGCPVFRAVTHSITYKYSSTSIKKLAMCPGNG